MKILKILSVLIAVTLFTADTLPQVLQWTQTYGGNGQDGGEAMTMTGSGDIVITGYKSPAPFGYRDVIMMKTDGQGNEIWSKLYNLNLNDYGRSIRNTQDGGFIIAGMTEVNPQTFDPFMIKTDAAGNIQWQRQYDYGFGADDRAHSVWQTSDGGYIAAGQTWLMHGAFGNYDIYIIKTDANGNVQWKRVYYRENEGADVALAIQQLSDGGYIIGGFTHSSQWASYIIRTDSIGNTVWSNVYPGSWQSECYDILATSDGGFIFTGTESSFETDTDVLITKLDASGNLIWKKIYGTINAEQGNSIKQLPGGGYIIAGMSSTESTSYDMYVIKTNSAGDTLWSSIIGGQGDDRAFSVVSPQPGAYYVSGCSWSFGLGYGDIYLMKITESLTGNIGNNSAPQSFSLEQNYPNPFNPATTIKFSLPESGMVSLNVFDASGRLVENLVKSNFSAGTHEVKWNGSAYSSGIYFYVLKSDGFSVTKKMILVK